MGSSMKTDTIIKRFDNPDEVREFEKGKFEIVNIGGMSIGRASYEPGWKWSEHVGQLARTDMCEVEHVGIVINGQSAVLMRDSKEIILRAGDISYVAPGHDSWVVGDEQYISLHLLGAGDYAASKK